ncbi:MAG: GGDEF domain-containing protein [Burkholderiales bacterium]|nr:GGDEF domain-containing protein [Burkholderiales bacterium]
MARRRWLPSIPPSLAEAYEDQRRDEFARLVSMWSPLLVLAYVGCLGFTWLFHAERLHGADLRVYARAEGLALLLGMGGLVLARRPRWQLRPDAWIPFCYGLIVFTKIGAGFLMRDGLLAANQVYITMLVVLIGMLALQLSLRAALMGFLLGLSAFAMAPWLADGRYAWMFLGHYLLTSGVCLFVAMILEDKDRMAFLQAMLLERERKEVQRLNLELAEMARRDGLTGLANRRHFDEVLQREWERSRRGAHPLALLMIDVDHFKAFNDHHGHPAGDGCLAQVAQALSSVVKRPADLVARYGGEEFVALLPDTDAEGARELARRLIEQVDRVALRHGASPAAAHVTVSVGGSVLRPGSGASAQELLAAADAALYQAKAGGRHGFGFQACEPTRLR